MRRLMRKGSTSDETHVGLLMISVRMEAGEIRDHSRKAGDQHRPPALTSNRRFNMYGGQLRYDLASDWDGEEDHEDIETDEEVDDE